MLNRVPGRRSKVTQLDGQNGPIDRREHDPFVGIVGLDDQSAVHSCPLFCPNAAWRRSAKSMGLERAVIEQLAGGRAAAPVNA